MQDEQIAIRSLQHYLYCPHRWGMIEIGKMWSENYYVVKADLMHERVHSAVQYALRGDISHTSVSVWNDNYGIYGVVDCILERNNELCIVEYKPKKPENCEYNYEDAFQVFAQKVCAEYVFKKHCNTELYYCNVKRRVKLPLDEQYEEYKNKLINVLSEMRSNLSSGIIPPVRQGQNCNGCSMADLCMPKLKCRDIKKQLFNLITENDI